MKAVVNAGTYEGCTENQGQDMNPMEYGDCKKECRKDRHSDGAKGKKNRNRCPENKKQHGKDRSEGHHGNNGNFL